ncbi:hypothetical protein EVAR_78642_1 [Eumeta japonica]|uniref:Glyoxylate reductase/hydroxypyruvate reductase n=1 Tax=Eumeta variegata TaxID=151549 RepID=A0A4C1U997_EUMVA|nr:hypothetical protein EVAR_78642_1 [Eumeta japonica]
MSKTHKVLVSSNDYPESALKLLQDNFTVVQTKYCNFGPEGLEKAYPELLTLIPGCSALVWQSHHPVTNELLDRAGYNHCNVEELRARFIKLSNTPNVLSTAVAELTVALMLGTARRFTENLDQVKRGEWEIGFQKVLGTEIRGSTVGIIGLGGIGQTIVRKLNGWEVARFLYTGHREKPEGKDLGAQFVSLDTLLSQSDFVVLAVPLNNETRHMINRQTLAKMKKSGILINIGRGDLVDQEALYEALSNGTIGAAGLDVTTPEPLPRDHPLLTLSNIFVLPHIGSATVRTRRDMAELAARNVIKALNGEPLLTPVLP